MSKFFVGQMVRVVKPLLNPKFLGEERRIIAFGFWPKNFRRACDCTIELDDGYVVAEFQIEPILDSHQPCDAEFKESLDTLLEGLTRPCKGEV